MEIDYKGSKVINRYESGSFMPPDSLTPFENNTDYFILISSTSNSNVAFGGITPPAPRGP